MVCLPLCLTKYNKTKPASYGCLTGRLWVEINESLLVAILRPTEACLGLFTLSHGNNQSVRWRHCFRPWLRS